MISPNGIAHIQLTVRDVAASRPFYFKLLHETLGMPIQYDAPDIFYCIGGRTGVAIRGAAPSIATRISTNGASASIISASACARGRTSIRCMPRWPISAPRSSARLKAAPGRRDIIPCCSRIPTVSASKACSFPAAEISTASRTRR